MSGASIHKCTLCGEKVSPERRNYRYAESGISNIILQGIEVCDCAKCGNSAVIIPRMAMIHRAIAQALANSPDRLTGEHPSREVRDIVLQSGMEHGAAESYDKLAELLASHP